MEQQDDTMVRPRKISGDLAEGTRNWDDPNGLGRQVRRRVNFCGVLSRPMQKDIRRFRNIRMIGYSPLANILLKRFGGYPYGVAGLSMPLVNPLFFMFQGARHTPLIPSGAQPHSANVPSLLSPQAYRAPYSVSPVGDVLQPILMPSDSTPQTIDAYTPPSSNVNRAASQISLTERGRQPLLNPYGLDVQSSDAPALLLPHVFRADSPVSVTRSVPQLSLKPSSPEVHYSKISAMHLSKLLKAGTRISLIGINKQPSSSSSMLPAGLVDLPENALSGELNSEYSFSSSASLKRGKDNSGPGAHTADIGISRLQVNQSLWGQGNRSPLSYRGRRPFQAPMTDMKQVESLRRRVAPNYNKVLQRSFHKSGGSGSTDYSRGQAGRHLINPVHGDIFRVHRSLVKVHRQLPIASLNLSAQDQIYPGIQTEGMRTNDDPVGVFNPPVSANDRLPGIIPLAPPVIFPRQLIGGPDVSVRSLSVPNQTHTRLMRTVLEEKAQGATTPKPLSSKSPDFQVLPSISRVQTGKTFAPEEHSYMTRSKLPIDNNSDGTGPAKVPFSFHTSKKMTVSRHKAMPLSNPTEGVKIATPVLETLPGLKVDGPQNAIGLISGGISPSVHRSPELTGQPEMQSHPQLVSDLASGAKQSDINTGRAAAPISVRRTYRSVDGVSRKPSFGNPAVENFSGRLTPIGSRQKLVQTIPMIQRVSMSQNNTPIQSDPTPDAWVLPFNQGNGYAVKETGPDKGPNREARLRFSGFNHPDGQTEVGLFSAAEPKISSRTLLFSFIGRKTDSIRPDDGKGFGKTNQGMPMIGFRSVLPLIAQRSTETLMKTTSDRGKKLDLFQHLHAPHTIFPLSVQDPAVGCNSRPGRQAIGPLVSFAQDSQGEAHSLTILRSKRSGIQRQKTADILERAASDDMPFLDPKRAQISESPVSRQLSPSVVQTVRQTSIIRGNIPVPGVPATETVSSEMTVGGANSSQTPPSNPDVDELVEKIWRKFNRKLTLEQERGGYGKWL